MTKYILVEWPEIQDYMNREDYGIDSYYDPERDVYFIPEDWELEVLEEPEMGTKEYFDAHDCWDAIGGDWEG